MKIWTGVGKILGSSGLLVWFSLAGLSIHYNDTRPTVMQPAEGRVYALMNHGHIAYLTLQEQHNLDILERVASILCVAFLCVGLWDYLRQHKDETKAIPTKQN